MTLGGVGLSGFCFFSSLFTPQVTAGLMQVSLGVQCISTVVFFLDSVVGSCTGSTAERNDIKIILLETCITSFSVFSTWLGKLAHLGKMVRFL